jgi:deoxyadenosine/deoxycytidine kinase
VEGQLQDCTFPGTAYGTVDFDQRQRPKRNPQHFDHMSLSFALINKCLHNKLSFYLYLHITIGNSFQCITTMTKVFAIEGNIAAGKSTLLDLLAQKYVVFQEPLQDWQAVSGPDGQVVNMFDIYCKDMQTYSFPFQLITLQSIVNVLRKALATGEPFVFVERSFLSNLHVFTKAQKSMGFINEVEWIVYHNILTSMLPKADFEFAGIIYLKTSPSKCYHRIKQRNRKEENELSIRYLTELHKNHEKWLSEVDSRTVLIIDNDIEKYNSSDYENDIARIKSFVSEMTAGD